MMARSGSAAAQGNTLNWHRSLPVVPGNVEQIARLGIRQYFEANHKWKRNTAQNLCVAIYESAPSCQPQFCFLVRRRQAPLCSS